MELIADYLRTSGTFKKAPCQGNNLFVQIVANQLKETCLSTT